MLEEGFEDPSDGIFGWYANHWLSVYLNAATLARDVLFARRRAARPGPATARADVAADDISTSPFEKTDTRRVGVTSLLTTTKPTLSA